MQLSEVLDKSEMLDKKLLIFNSLLNKRYENISNKN